jgi:hypothetical protein
MKNDLKEIFGEPISVYTSKEAVEDNILFDLDQLKYRKDNPTRAAQTPLKYVTTNLMARGYINDNQTLNLPNIMDLILAAGIILSKMPKGDYFAEGRIELPDGSKQLIYIAQNETGRYTVMLPEDY